MATLSTPHVWDLATAGVMEPIWSFPAFGDTKT